jgi:hypothetical protein
MTKEEIELKIKELTVEKILLTRRQINILKDISFWSNDLDEIIYHYDSLLDDELRTINAILKSNEHYENMLSRYQTNKIMLRDINKELKQLNEELNKPRTILDIVNLRKERMDIVNKQKGLLKQEKTKQIINDAIENWSASTKITTAGIAESTGLSLRTVKTYWSDFKEHVADLNKKFKLKK